MKDAFAEVKDAFAEGLKVNGGSVGKRIVEHPWQQSELGPIESWPANLRTALGVCLSLPLPSILVWGDSFIQFYNDTTQAQLAASTGLLALGQSAPESVPDFWQLAGRLVEQIVASGQRGQINNQLLCLEPSPALGSSEDIGIEAWCISSEGMPILGDQGQVDGVMLVLTDVRMQAVKDFEGAQSCDRLPSDVCDRSPLEAELALHQQKYQSIFENAGVAIVEEDFTQVKAWVDDLQQQGVTDLRRHFREHPADLNTVMGLVDIQAINQTALKLLQAASKGELLESFEHILLPETRQVFVEKLVALAVGQPLLEMETKIRTLNGSILHILITATFTVSASDHCRVLVTMLDITQRHWAEAARQRSEAILQAFFEASPVGFALFDKELRYTYINQALASINNIPLADHLGRTVPEVMPYVAKECVPMFQHILATGQSYMNYEYKGRSFPGGPMRYCLANHFSVSLPNGEIIGVGVTVMDITELKHAETALRMSEAEARARADDLETLMATVPAPLWIAHDPDCHIVTANQAAYDVMRVDPDEVAPVTPADGSFPFAYTLCKNGHPLAPERLPLQRAASTGEIVEEDFELVFGDDDVRYLYGKAVPLYHPDGGIRGAIAACLDVTDRKLAETSLQESETRFRLAVRAVKGIVYDWDVRTHQVYRSEGLFELIGVHPDALPPTREGWADRIHPEDQSLLADQMQRLLAERGDRYAFEYRVRHEDGRWIHAWDQGYLLHNEQGQLIRVVGSTIDISDRKQAEEALRLSERRYRTLANAVPQLMWVNDAQGKVQFFNSRWSEYTDESLELGVSLWLHLIHPDDLDQIQAVKRAAVEAKTAYEMELRLKRRDQVYRWHLARIVPLKDQDGEVVNWFGTAMDVHDQKCALEERDAALRRERAAREDAEAANRIKDEFLAVLSHELRSPLNPILGWASLLRKRQVNEQTVTRALETIERNVKLQLQLIDDLLDVSRILRGKLVLEKKAVHLRPVVEGAIETVRLAAEAKSIQITTQVDPELGAVLGDDGRLQQIVWNLLSNAVKFTPDGGQVQVRLQAAESEALIQVEDTGKGISSSFLPYVFDYFRQEDGTTTRKFGGLGLGLAIVRYITEMHGGSVQVESKGEGQGALFTVRLPLLRAMQPPPPQSPAVETASVQSLQGLRILIVEDEQDTRDFLSYLLGVHGAKLTVAASAQDALKAIALSRPDLVISDIAMPDMDGYMLMGQLRRRFSATARGKTKPKSPSGLPFPTIALTAYAGDADIKRVTAAGFDRHVPKPIDVETLIRAIVELLEP